MLFFIVATPFCIPSNSIQGYQVSIPLLAFVVFCFAGSNPDAYEVKPRLVGCYPDDGRH